MPLSEGEGAGVDDEDFDAFSSLLHNPNSSKCIPSFFAVRCMSRKKKRSPAAHKFMSLRVVIQNTYDIWLLKFNEVQVISSGSCRFEVVKRTSEKKRDRRK